MAEPVIGYQCPHCEKGAFYLKERPTPMSTVSAENAFCHPQNPAPIGGQVIKCQWCGESLNRGPVLDLAAIKQFDYETGELHG